MSRLLRLERTRRNITPSTKRAMTASPPTTPPTIAPTGVDFEFEAGGVVETAVEVELAELLSLLASLVGLVLLPSPTPPLLPVVVGSLPLVVVDSLWREMVGLALPFVLGAAVSEGASELEPESPPTGDSEPKPEEPPGATRLQISLLRAKVAVMYVRVCWKVGGRGYEGTYWKGQTRCTMPSDIVPHSSAWRHMRCRTGTQHLLWNVSSMHSYSRSCREHIGAA